MACKEKFCTYPRCPCRECPYLPEKAKQPEPKKVIHMRKSQSGFTLWELLVAVFGVAAIAAAVGAAWVAIHFIRKFW